MPLFWQICVLQTEVLSYFTFLKLVCIGETKRRLKDRFNEGRRAVDKTNITSKSTTASEHFLCHSNYSHTDMQLIPLEKNHSSRDSVHKARESHLIDKAMTLEPNGLNRHDELLLFFLFQFFLCCTSFPPLPFKQFLKRHSSSSLYNIVIPIMNSRTSVNLNKAAFASRKRLLRQNNTRCSDQLCSSLWTSSFCQRKNFANFLSIKLWNGFIDRLCIT